MKHFLLSIILLSAFASLANPINDTLVSESDTMCEVIPEIDSVCLSETLWINTVFDSLETHLGTPYKYGGVTPSGFDCSGLFYAVFKDFGVKLSRSSRGLAHHGVEVELENLQPGDLLFFKGRNINSKTIGHVAMVIELTDGSFKMIHSCSRGVIIDEYSEISYYRKRFVTARRLDYTYLQSLAVR